MTKIFQFINVELDLTYLYLVYDNFLWVFTEHDWQKSVIYSNIDDMLRACEDDYERYRVTEFQMKGEWFNHD